MKDTENKNLVSMWCAGEKNPDLINVLQDLKKEYNFDIDANAWGDHGQVDRSKYTKIVYIIHGDKNDDFDRLKQAHDEWKNVLIGCKAIMTSNCEEMRSQMPKFNVQHFMNCSNQDTLKGELMNIFEREFRGKMGVPGEKECRPGEKMKVGTSQISK